MPSSIELADKVHLLEREISRKDQQIDAKDQRIKLLEEYIRLHNSKTFGASSEKGDGGQGQLFNEAESESEIDSDEDVGGS